MKFKVVIVLALVLASAGTALATITTTGPCMSGGVVLGSATDSEGGSVAVALVFFCDPSSGVEKKVHAKGTKFAEVTSAVPTSTFLDCDDTIKVRLYVNGTAQGAAIASGSIPNCS